MSASRIEVEAPKYYARERLWNNLDSPPISPRTKLRRIGGDAEEAPTLRIDQERPDAGDV
jgi:hypothetical protein